MTRRAQLLVAGQWLMILGLLAWVIAREPGDAEIVPASQRTPDRLGDHTEPDPAERATLEPRSTAPGAAAGRTALALAGPRAWHADDPVGLIVFGRVTDRDGAFLERVHVELSRDGVTRRAVQREEPGYAVVGLSPGTWSVTVTCSGHEPLEQEIALSAAPIRTRLDLDLEPATIVDVFVRVPDGRPWHEVRRAARVAGDVGLARTSVGIQTRTEPFGERTTPRPTAARWSYDYRGFEERHGTLQLTAAPPIHIAATLGRVVLATGRIDRGDEAVVLVVEPAAVTGSLGSATVTVRDPIDGQPVGGAQVAFNADTGTTGADGTVTLERLHPAHRHMSVQAVGRESRTLIVDIAPGTRTELEVTLGTVRTLSGRVLTTNGEPLAADSLTWTPVDHLDRPLRTWARATRIAESRASGEFQVMLGPRRYVLRAEHRDHAQAVQTVDLTTGPTTGIELRLPKGQPVTFRLAQAVSRSVVVWSAEGIPLWSDRVGRTTSLRLPVGTYRLDVDDGEGVQTRQITITAGDNEIVL